MRMDTLGKFEKIASIAEEIIGEEQLLELLNAGRSLVAYDGFEPSGMSHVPFGVIRPLNLRPLLDAGIKFKLLIADTFAWINGKLGGDLDRIRQCGEYFVEVWKAAGVDFEKVEVVWHKELFDDPEYWRKVLLIAQNHTLKRSLRSLAIAGKAQGNANEMAVLFYPSMQCADIFQLDVDICQLGMDQRKVNMLARDVSDGLGWKKPICIHHHLLPGLSKPQTTGEVFDEDEYINRQIASKSSKSKGETSIYVHDEADIIQRKIQKAWCPPESIDNPVLEHVREISFRAFGRFQVGESREFMDYLELERAYSLGEIHAKDIKEGLYHDLERLISPIRKHFKSGYPAKLLEVVLEAEKEAQSKLNKNRKKIK
jgi:tyrosyl-tRNA synthetase